MKVERPNVVWKPSPEQSRESQLGRFAESHGFEVNEYDALHRWSVSNSAEFFTEVWEFFGLKGALGARPQVDTAEMGKRHFFPEGKMNMAENLLRHKSDSLAVIEMTAAGEVERKISYGALREDVHNLAIWLQAKGVQPGDVIATISPNRVEALVSFLATSAIGALWTSASPDLSAQAILDRFGQVAPVVLFACAQYSYNNKQYEITDTLQLLMKEIPTIRETVLIGQSDNRSTDKHKQLHATPWEEARGDGSRFGYERYPFNSPFLVLYTSGTTGKPKAIVHSAGGVLLRTSVELGLHHDIGPGDIFFWYTNIAWMMFPYLAMGLTTGAAIVLYGDAPVKKSDNGDDVKVLWQIAQNAEVTTMGLSPGYLRIVERNGYSPQSRHDLSPLRNLITTGAPMPPELYYWCRENVSSHTRLTSISGGSEVMGGFVTGSPFHEVRAGEISCKILGIAVDVFDERGVSVVGEKGELVITQPFPSMPLTFWGQDGDQRYHSAYFSKFAGIWTHGDLAEATVSGGFLIHGRSDNTLNPGGVRIGTADIYNALDGVSEIKESVVFAQPVEHDEEIVLCVQLASELNLDDSLAAAIRNAIRTQNSSRHVPARIYEVADIPQTQNGKRNEAAAKAAYLGTDTTRFTSLANPQCLKEYGSLNTARGF